MFDFWNDWAFDFSMIQSVPVNGFKECVGLHESSAVDTVARNVAKPLRWIDRTETANEVACIGRHPLRVFKLSFYDSDRLD